MHCGYRRRTVARRPVRGSLPKCNVMPEPADWIHWGDNSHSDVAVPRSIGIAAEAFEDSQLQPLKTVVRGKGPKGYGMSKLAGVTRLTLAECAG